MLKRRVEGGKLLLKRKAVRGVIMLRYQVPLVVVNHKLG
jgi:hypothetical protein